MAIPAAKDRPCVKNRLGGTWQDPQWRKRHLGPSDVTKHAAAALARLCRGPSEDGAARHEDHALSFARTRVPFTGDGVAATGPFPVDPQAVRGFA